VILSVRPWGFGTASAGTPPSSGTCRETGRDSVSLLYLFPNLLSAIVFGWFLAPLSAVSLAKALSSDPHDDTAVLIPSLPPRWKVPTSAGSENFRDFVDGLRG